MGKDFQTTLVSLYYSQRAAFCAVVISAVIFFGAIAHVIMSWRLLTLQTTPSAATSTQIVSMSVPVSQIPQWHLMGGGGSGPLPKTILALTLHGVLMSSDSKQSLAIISSLGQNEKLYKIGDSLPNGAILYEILEDNVVLKNNGQLEQLPLSRPKLIITPVPQSTWR